MRTIGARGGDFSWSSREQIRDIRDTGLLKGDGKQGLFAVKIKN